MRNSLDPRNPAYAWMGVRECENTVLFIDKRGGLAWVPYAALDSHFKRELPRHRFIDWHTKLCKKECHK